MSSHAYFPETRTHKGFTVGIATRVFLILALGLLMFAMGCGSSGSSIPITGGFSNSSLNGAYTYHLYGLDTTANQYAEAGTFVADGNGNITSGIDDFNQLGSGFSPQNTLTGKYSISKDGNGVIQFTINGQSGNTFQVAVTLVSTSKLYITEADNFANASGEANKQNTSAFTTPSGSFAFRMHDLGATTEASLVGAVTSTGGQPTGTLDELRDGTLHSNVSITAGTFSAPDTTGRGVFSFIDSLGITSSYVYYMIDGNTLELLQSDDNNLGLGRIEKQSGGPYSLSGTYVFGSSGDTNSNILGVRSAGGFTSNGTSITGGAYDSVQDGGQVVNQAFTGSFNLASNGRADVTLNPNGQSPIHEVFWMVNSNRAFFLIDDPNKTEDGTIDLQSGGAFTNASLKGQYAFVNDGFFFSIAIPYLTRVGTFIPDGNGNVNLNEVTNNFGPTAGGSVQNVVVSGTYAVSSPGRATATINGGSNTIDLVMYMSSGSQAYVIQNDPGTEIGGQLQLQVSP